MSQDAPKPAPSMPAPAPADGGGTTAYRVTLPEFEGPLDLLLHLCQTHELDILNISMAFIAEKYIEYLELMQDMSVEVAADYLVMAAHLMYLKSRELVPTPETVEATEEGEEPIDPREELIRRLLEYQKYKHAAETLGNRPIEGRNIFIRGAVLEPPGEAGLAEHSVWKLIEHWAGLVKKAKPQYTHDVVVDRMSITDRINQIVDLLTAGKGMVRFEDLLGEDLPPAELRHKVVVSLLAVLELARLRVIRILQQIETGSFFLAQTDNADLEGARHLQVTSAKQEEPAEKDEDPEKLEKTDAATDPTNETPAGDVEPALSATASDAAAGGAASESASAEDLFAEDTSEVTTADALASPRSPLEEGATAAIIASAEDAAAEATDAADEAAMEFPDEENVPGTDEGEALAESNDSVRQGHQDGVISAPFPAPAPESEEPSNGQTQEEQETSEK